MKPVSHLDSYRLQLMADAPPVPGLPMPWDARVARPDGYDLHLVHRWNQAPHVAAFRRQAWTVPQWERRLAELLAGDDVRPVLISWHGRPVIYAEVYRAVQCGVGVVLADRPPIATERPGPEADLRDPHPRLPEVSVPHGSAPFSM